jgi:hypothetical protein
MLKIIMGRKKGYKHTKEEIEKIRESCINCPVIHHINGNHFDDRPENRMVVTPSEHAKIHMLQGNIHTFKNGHKINIGKKHTMEWKKEKSKSMKGVRNALKSKLNIN